MFKKFAATLAVLFAANASFAATETFTFTGKYEGKRSGYHKSMDWTGTAGGAVQVTAGYMYKGVHYASTVGHWKHGGLGACNHLSRSGKWCKEKHTVDGAYKRDDYLKFSLAKDATITKITFSDYGKNRFVLNAKGMTSHLGYGRVRGHKAAWKGKIDVGSTFFVGAQHKKSAFKIRSITVEYAMNGGPVAPVPVPAAGVLLLGGLGGLAAFKRRKRS